VDIDQKKDGRGRPVKRDKEKLKTRFSVALNDADYEKFEKALEASGTKQSHYTRTIIMNGVDSALIPHK